MMEPPENLSIGDLFSGRVPFLIEKYQRDYAWTNEQIDDFIKDISYLYEKYDSVSPESRKEKRHFFGGIVSVLKVVPATSTGRVYEVVDGQQRLATFMIAINHLSAAYKELADTCQKTGNTEIEDAARVQREDTEENFVYYKEIEGSRRVPKLRLQLSKADKDVFERVIKGQEFERERESHNRLNYANINIKRRLIDNPILTNQDYDYQQKLVELNKLLSCLVDNCHVIHIISKQKKDAYRLFTILNDRGRTLSDGDLLRSYTLEKTEDFPTLQYNIERYWDQILSKKLEEIDTFLRNSYASKFGKRAPRRELFDTVKDTVFKSDDPSEIELQVKILFDEFKIFNQLTQGDWPYQPSIVSEWNRNRLKRISYNLGHTLCYPLLISAKECLDEIMFSNIVLILDCFVFRYITICKGSASELDSVYLKHAKNIRDSAFSFENMKQDLKGLLDRYASEGVFREKIDNSLEYSKSSTRKKQAIKHLYSTIEDYYRWCNDGCNGNPVPEKERVFDFDSIEIEHIYPQSPQDLDNDLDLVKHFIGNLSIWAPGDNKAANNAPFPSKKPLYINSQLRINREELKGIDNWTIENYKKRSERITQWALKIFDIY